MCNESRIVEIIRARQIQMREEIDRRGILMKVVASKAGLSYSTLLTYFPADDKKVPAQIPGSVIYALTGHLPEDILSMLLPAGHVILKAPEEIDHDWLAEKCRDYLAVKDHAHHPESPAGRDIASCEDNVLRVKLAVLKAA